MKEVRQRIRSTDVTDVTDVTEVSQKEESPSTLRLTSTQRLRLPDRVAVPARVVEGLMINAVVGSKGAMTFFALATAIKANTQPLILRVKYTIATRQYLDKSTFKPSIKSQ